MKQFIKNKDFAEVETRFIASQKRLLAAEEALANAPEEVRNAKRFVAKLADKIVTLTAKAEAEAEVKSAEGYLEDCKVELESARAEYELARADMDAAYASIKAQLAPESKAIDLEAEVDAELAKDVAIDKLTHVTQVAKCAPGDRPFKIKRTADQAWEAERARAIEMFAMDPSDTNKAMALALGASEEVINSIADRKASIKNVSDILGYNVNTKTFAYANRDEEKYNFVMAYGSEEDRKNAEDYMSEINRRMEMAAAITAEESTKALDDAGIFIEEFFVSNTENNAVKYETKKAEAKAIRLMIAGKDKAANELLNLINGEKDKEFEDKFVPAELAKQIRSFQATEVWTGCKNSYVVSVTKLFYNKPDVAYEWLNGFKGGYKEMYPSLIRVGEFIEMERPQTSDEAKEISAKRVRGLATIIAPKLTEMVELQNGDIRLKKGVRYVDIDNALVGFFGDPTGEYAVEGAKRAAALTDILDEKFACGFSLREALVEIQNARNERAAIREMLLENEVETSGGSSASIAFNKSYQTVRAEHYGVDELSDEMSERDFVKSAFAYNPLKFLILDFVAIMNNRNRLENTWSRVQAEYKKETGHKAPNFRQWAVMFGEAIDDMFSFQDEIRADFEYKTGDMFGLITAIRRSFIKAYKMAHWSESSAWCKMYGFAGYKYTKQDIFLALSADENKLFKLVDSALTKKSADLTRGVVRGICTHQLPGVWKSCEARPENDIEIIGFEDIASMSDGMTFGSEEESVVYGCTRYEESRNTVKSTIMNVNNIIVWYGKLALAHGAEEADIALGVREWLTGAENGLKPWEVESLVDLVPGNPIFNMAAKAQFGTGDLSVTIEDVKLFDEWLRSTVDSEKGGSAILRGILEFVYEKEETEKAVQNLRDVKSEANHN